MILIYIEDDFNYEVVTTDIPFNEVECQAIIKDWFVLAEQMGNKPTADISNFIVCRIEETNMDFSEEILEVDGCVVRYHPSYKECEVVCFPEIQDYQEEDWFENEAILINTEKGIEDYGYSAYFIPVDRIKVK